MRTRVAHGWGIRIVKWNELAIHMHQSKESFVDLEGGPIFRLIRVVLVPLADYRRLLRKAKAADAGSRKGASRG